MTTEHDPHLINNRRTANRFCELIAASPDSPEAPLPAEAADERPVLRSAHTFIVKDEVVGRGDPALAKTMTGSLDDCWSALDSINRTRRAGVFLALDAKAIVADFAGEPSRAFPLPPSLSVTYGWAAPPDRLPLHQHVWLLTDDTPQRDRADIAAQLRVLGAKSVGDRVRVPGFHARLAEPTLVNFSAVSEAGQLDAVTRYDPAHLQRYYVGTNEAAA